MPKTKKFTKKQWMKRGLLMGLILFLLHAFGFPLLRSEPLYLKEIMLNLAIWSVFGVLMGYLMIFLQKKGFS